MTTLMNGLLVPHFLIIDKTRTKEVNEKDEERKETDFQQHKSSSDTFHLLDEAERKRNKDDE